MIRSFALAASGLSCFLIAEAQYVTYRFTDGSLVSHAVTDVRSTDLVGADMRVFLWDGTIYTWSLSSLANYQFTDITTAVPTEAAVLAPLVVYPNPTSGEVHIGITARGGGDYYVEVLDPRGGVVHEVHVGPLSQGQNQLVWDGRDAQGRPVSNGNYLVRVVQGPRAIKRQVILQH
jgi:hypothetical protein